MAYSVPPLYAPKTNLNAPGTSVNYWSDSDANVIGTALTSTIGYINAVSGGLQTTSSSLGAVSSSLVGVSSSLVVLSGVVAGFVGGSDPNVSATVVYLAQSIFGTQNLAQTSVSTGTHPTGTFYNLREGYYTLTASYNGTSASLSGVINSSSLMTPSAMYLKSPDLTVWRITIDNFGSLSSSVA